MVLLFMDSTCWGEEKQPLMYGVLEETVVDSVPGTVVITTSVVAVVFMLLRLFLLLQEINTQYVREVFIPVVPMSVLDVEDVPLTSMVQT